MEGLKPSRDHVQRITFNNVMHKVNATDKDNFSHSYSLIERDDLSDKLEKISYETKLKSSLMEA
ncbi:START-like domain containing protein [Trema orientale]|uniref:START-like domain containing protein n=1 Tax=Trema orientale TaxID=63057 RepID=A0A2P5CRY3_TREOI|nr:START-like domain containing protein [Trema orientale]